MFIVPLFLVQTLGVLVCDQKTYSSFIKGARVSHPPSPPPFFFFRNRDVGLFSLFLSFSFVVCVEIVLIFLIGKKG